MKKIILLFAYLLSFNAFAQDIYAHKAKDGSTILSIKKDESIDYVEVKKIHIDDSDITGWKVNCSKDRFNGTKSCSLNKPYRDLMVTLIDGSYGVYVGGNHFPNTTSAIKVDNNPTIYGYEGVSKTPLKVIEQMKRGKVAYTRYKEWPYEYNKDGEVELDGFAKKFEEMTSQYKEL